MRSRFTPTKRYWKSNLLAGSIAMSLALAAGGTEFHLGEDGELYPIDTSPVSKLETTASSRQVIDAVLLKEADELERLDVIVYLDLGSVTEAEVETVEQIKARHRPELESLGRRIATIEQKYRPGFSLMEQEEREFPPAVEAMMSARDQTEIGYLRDELDIELDAMRGEIAGAIQRRVASSQDTVVRFIESNGGKVVARINTTNALGADIPADLLEKLAAHDLVVSVVKDEPVDYELNVSVPSVGYDDWWAGGDDGGFFDVGVVDSGVKENHPAFSGKNFISKPGSTINNGHGTHVTGIVASENATYRGGAFGLETIIWANSGGQATTMANMDWMATTPAQRPEVINHSLGYGTANTDYNANDSFYDAFIDNFDIMVSKSAGNGGWSTTGRTITHPAPAYNLMAVANMDDQNTTGRSDDVRRGSSSVGPTVNNRKKPDITAPGTNIRSTHVRWDGIGPTTKCANTGSADYVDCSGTSMAAPHVAAGIVLMEDGGNHNPMAQKAVLINTADAWTSNNTATTADDGPVSGSQWDRSYGWGYLDMDEAHFNRGDYFASSVLDRVRGRNDNATPDDYKLYRGHMFTNEKATLVWQKRAGTYNSGAPSTNQFSLTDLNIRLYDGDNGSLVDFDFDGNDNVHQVAADSSMDAVIKVYSWSTSVDGATYEPYALATEENFERADPPSFIRSYSKPTWVGPFQTFNVNVSIHNNGDVPAHSNTLTLSNVGNLLGEGNRSLATIQSGSHQSASYTLTTSNPPAGVMVVPLSVASNSYAETYTLASSIVLNVERTPPVGTCTSPSTDFFSPIPVSWSASDTQTGVSRSYLYVQTPGATGWSYTGLSSAGTAGTFNYVPSAGYGTYRFAVRSRDNGGNWEAFPVGSDCATRFQRLWLIHQPILTPVFAR